MTLRLRVVAGLQQTERKTAVCQQRTRRNDASSSGPARTPSARSATTTSAESARDANARRTSESSSSRASSSTTPRRRPWTPRRSRTRASSFSSADLAVEKWVQFFFFQNFHSSHFSFYFVILKGYTMRENIERLRLCASVERRLVARRGAVGLGARRQVERVDEAGSPGARQGCAWLAQGGHVGQRRQGQGLPGRRLPAQGRARQTVRERGTIYTKKNRHKYVRY